jgi:hypothetical protein
MSISSFVANQLSTLRRMAVIPKVVLVASVVTSPIVSILTSASTIAQTPDHTTTDQHVSPYQTLEPMDVLNRAVATHAAGERTETSSTKSDPWLSVQSRKPVSPLRGELAKERVDRLRPEFGEIHQGLNLGLAIHDDQPTIRRGNWVAFEYFIQNAGERTRMVEFCSPIAADVSRTTFRPIRITLQPNEIYGTIARFRVGPSHDDGKIESQQTVNRSATTPFVTMSLRVSVSGYDDPETMYPVTLISGDVEVDKKSSGSTMPFLQVPRNQR